MKRVFKRLFIEEPKPQVGKTREKCKFKVAEVIIDMDDISVIQEQVSFGTTNSEKDIDEWLTEHNLIGISIYTKRGGYVTNVLVPNMEFIKSKLDDIALS